MKNSLINEISEYKNKYGDEKTKENMKINYCL